MSYPVGAPSGDEPLAGDAGRSFLASVLAEDGEGGGAIGQAIAFHAGAREIKTLAENGGFAINEAGALEYLKLCDMYLDGYAARADALFRLSQRAKLGSSPYAYQVAEHNIKVFTGDEKSLIPNLELMKDGFIQLREAFLIARRNYRETDAEHNQVFRKINP